MIVRFEPFGAWVKLEKSAAVVALDREGVRALGLDGGAAWTEGARARASLPLEVHAAVTSRCAVGCEGCYLDARPDGTSPPFEVLLETFDALAKAGVFTVAFGGGEPTLRDDLGLLAEAARARGLTPVVTTSGIGLGPRKLAQLAAFAQVNVSYDGEGATYAAVRGFDASDEAERAIAALAAAGTKVGVNVVLTRTTFERIDATLARARELGAREAQLLRYKPAGRAKSPDYLLRRLRDDQARALGPTLRRIAGTLGDDFHVRIDCALVPFLVADEAIAADPAALARWGVFGCEAGNALAATKIDGSLAPCSFAAASGLHVHDIARGWADDPTLGAFRDHVAAPPEPCASCTLRAVCRGGCKIVSLDASGAIGPDPECPRVRDSGRGRA